MASVSTDVVDEREQGRTTGGCGARTHPETDDGPKMIKRGMFVECEEG